jgi:hypothetical protein
MPQLDYGHLCDVSILAPQLPYQPSLTLLLQSPLSQSINCHSRYYDAGKLWPHTSYDSSTCIKIVSSLQE